MEHFNNADCLKLYKGAARFSDALVIHTDATSEMKKYLSKLTIPTLDHKDEDLGEVYTEFYENLTNQRN
jgi:hypothetical protein